MRRTTLVAVLPTLTLMVGCGGDDGASQSSVPEPSVRTAAPACGDESAPDDTTCAPERLPLVVDTDLAMDDLVALLYVAADPSVDLKAVTVSGTGEVNCPTGIGIARGILELMDLGSVPVACGRSTPLAGDRVFPATWRAAADTVYGLTLPAPVGPADERDAPALLTDTAAASPSPVTLLTLGPLTNVAEALAAEPALAEGIERIVVMGGALAVPGNVQPEGAAVALPVEWNLYIDPQAADDVVRSGIPVTLVPLDATNQVPVDAAVVDLLEANNRSQATSYAARLYAGAIGRDIFLWDPLAAVTAIHPDVVGTADATVSVQLDGEEAGRTVRATDGVAVRVADPHDPAAVLDHLVRRLAGLSDEQPLVPPTTLPLVGEVAIGFDGTSCAVDAPATVPPGQLRVTVTPGPVEYIGLVAHLVAGATPEQAMASTVAHPNDWPPEVDDVDFVGDNEIAVASPALVEVETGTVIVVCAVVDDRRLLGATLTVG